MNNPNSWKFNDSNIISMSALNFSDKDSPAFSSKLFLLKFYVLRKIDEVAFVTSRFVHCPTCNASYVVPAAKIDFQTTYKCERVINGKICKTGLKKFPARKMLPTYIYEIAVETKSKEQVEYKEFFLESFVDLPPGFFTGMVFGRTEQKTNSFYFTCLTAKEEKSKVEFKLPNEKVHNFFNIVEGAKKYIQEVGFVIDEDKANLPFMIETLKKLILITNKEINLDHSLYFGAPGIGKTHALRLLHHMYYSNTGFISGPRFSLPGLTGGQKEIFYQDTAKKKNVPGLFSNQAFIFDEINNAQFMSDDKAVNLFKAVALAPSGTSSTVGGKEFPRISLVAATANYDVGYLRYYTNKVKKIYSKENKSVDDIKNQNDFLADLTNETSDLPDDFDFFAPLKDYPMDTPKALKTAILKIRDQGVNYLTNFPKPLMERFFWSILVHPKYDKSFLKKKSIDVNSFLKNRDSKYTQRELIAQLFCSEFDSIILNLCKETRQKFDDKEVEEKWAKQAEEFLILLANKYVEFFSMFDRINEVNVFALFTLSLINRETELSYETKIIFERLISLLHTPIALTNFHKPDFEKFHYLGETRGDLIKLIKVYPNRDIRELINYEGRTKIRELLVLLENEQKIKKTSEFKYEIDSDPKFEVIK
jgi:hypothetical protein